MAWKQKVAGGFGVSDVVFAAHDNDKTRAKEAIAAAKAEGASFDDFEKEIVWYVYKKYTSPGMQQDHIAEQVKRARNLWN
jgi:hypothetical protein